MSLSELRAAYVAERPLYEQLAAEAEARLHASVRTAGLNRVSLGSRAKEVASFLRKAVSKEYSNPLAQIQDKAGLRAVGTYMSDCDRVEGLLDALYVIGERIDKRQALAEAELGYAGVHYILQLPDDGKTSSELLGRDFELQVRTKAEDLWAVMSHEMLYKGRAQLVGPARRQVYRLSAVSEIYDREASDAHGTMMNQPGYAEGRVIEALEDDLFRLTGRSDGDELTGNVVHALLPLYDPAEVERAAAYLSDFVATHLPKLEEIYLRYDGDTLHPLLFRPEALMIFDRLDRDKFQLRVAWDAHFPPEWLLDMGQIWGVTFEEEQ